MRVRARAAAAGRPVLHVNRHAAHGRVSLEHPGRTPMTPVAVGDTATAGRDSAVSVDGRWAYLRQPGGGGPAWRASFAPTGQDVPGGWSSLDEARRVTAEPTTMRDLRGAAFTAAFGPDSDDSRRLAGQRHLAVHLRLLEPVDPDGDCLACGGLVVQVTRDGRHCHVDACETCLPAGGPDPANCPDAAGHRFCPAPRPSLPFADRRILAFERRWWQRPGAKLDAIRSTFDLSEIAYYARLNRILADPRAEVEDAQLVRRLRRLQASRSATRG